MADGAIGTEVTNRPAEAQDLDAVLALAEARRRQYATYEPVFWRLAPGARAQQRPYLAGLLRNQDVLARVAVTDAAVVGFVIGRLAPAPPVYDPGGLTCLVDDITVAVPDLWPVVGVDLLREIRDAAGERGAVQVVVVAAHPDGVKRAALAAAGLAIASEWWTGPVDTG